MPDNPDASTEAGPLEYPPARRVEWLRDAAAALVEFLDTNPRPDRHEDGYRPHEYEDGRVAEWDEDRATLALEVAAAVTMLAWTCPTCSPAHCDPRHPGAVPVLD